MRPALLQLVKVFSDQRVEFQEGLELHDNAATDVFVRQYQIQCGSCVIFHCPDLRVLSAAVFPAA